MKNCKGQDITAVLDMLNSAVKNRDGSIEGEKEFHRWQNIFGIAMYQSLERAWAYYDQTDTNSKEFVYVTNTHA